MGNVSLMSLLGLAVCETVFSVVAIDESGENRLALVALVSRLYPHLLVLLGLLNEKAPSTAVKEAVLSA